MAEHSHPQQQSIPNSVLIPAGLYAIIAVVCAFGAFVNVATDTGRLAAIVYLTTLAMASAVTAVGLWRRWRPGYYLAFGLAGLLALGSLTNPGLVILALGFAAGVAWALLTRSAKGWFGLS